MTENDLENLIKEYSNATDFESKSSLGFQIITEYIARCDFDECRKIAYEINELSEKNNNLVTCFEAINSVRLSYELQKNFKQVKEVCNEILKIVQMIEDPFYQARAYHSLGAAEHNLGNFHGAIEIYTEAIKYYEKCSQNETMKDRINQNMAALYVNIALIYRHLKRADAAVEWCKKAIKVDKKMSNPQIIVNMGLCHLEKKDYALALGYFRRALKIAKEVNNYASFPNFFLVTASVYLARDQFEKAFPYLLDAYEYSQKYNPAHIFWACSELGYVYTQRKDFENAKKYFNEALNLIENKTKNEKIAFYQKYCEYCSLIGNDSDAYKYNKMCLELNKEIYNEDLLKQTTFMTAQFESEQTKKELEIYRLKNEELMNSQIIIEQKNNDLVYATMTKDNILGIISNDLRNYIGSILSANDIFITRHDAFAENKHIQTIKNSCNKALSLVNDILYMNNVDNEASSVLSFEYDINKAIEGFMENLRLLAKRKNIEIIIAYCSEIFLCDINKDKLHIVISNLFTNAIKYTPKNGKILAKTEKKDNIFNIHIRDSGIGMDETLVSKLFEKYSKTGRRGTEGEESKGLGLYIVKTILDKYNAKIDVISEVGKGSEFIVSIPI
ncbi:MAG: tetratricopeptide repeat-containing sensor histidine kinase [Candidatus Cloacimonetes bacterium]|nr:tetratricopeptide repeat-containing sensor histidine kinase [Candidatus Cloacimonadota bacterium]